MRHLLQGIGLSSTLICALGCGNAARGGGPQEKVGQTEDALDVAIGPHAVAYDLVHSADLIHGIAGDERFVFLSEPLNGRVTVESRFTGKYIADLPPPPGGFLLPFTLRSPRGGRLVVLDSGGFPSPAAPAIPKLYEYDYHWDLEKAAFEATLARTISFQNLPFVFSEDFEIVDDGYVVSDSVIGALWLVAANGAITPGLVPSDFAVGLPLLAPCIKPPVIIDSIPYDLGGGFAPGVGSLAYSKGYVYFGGFCPGGVHRVSLATLKDTTRTAEVRAADIQTVSAAAPGTTELIKGLTFNRFDTSDDRLYAADSFKLRMIRINVDTGTREVLSDDKTLFNFPVSAAFLPPEILGSPLVVASDQEHRLDALNFAIDSDLTQPPFIAAKLFAQH